MNASAPRLRLTSAAALCALVAVLGLVGCSTGISGVPVGASPNFDPYPSDGSPGVVPYFEWVDETHFTMDTWVSRAPCGSGAPTVVAESATELHIHYAIKDQNAICDASEYNVAYEFELPEDATGRPLQITVTAENLKHVDHGTLE
ncbi:MAG: hypothetical protein ACTIA6_07160 [Pseudoclavibacter sp.]